MRAGCRTWAKWKMRLLPVPRQRATLLYVISCMCEALFRDRPSIHPHIHTSIHFSMTAAAAAGGQAGVA